MAEVEPVGGIFCKCSDAYKVIRCICRKMAMDAQ